jgi:acyl carrier protein
LLDLVRREAATVLALTSPGELDIDRPLQEIGLDSLMAVEIRNRLAAATGQKLPATLLFNHPTVSAISRMILPLLIPRSALQYSAIKDNEIRLILKSISMPRLRASGLLERLLTLVDYQEIQGIKHIEQTDIEEISAMNADELVKLTLSECANID